MAIEYCYLLEDNVSTVRNSDGVVVNVVCPKFRNNLGKCQLRVDGVGFAGFVIQSLITTPGGGVYCEFVDPKEYYKTRWG